MSHPFDTASHSPTDAVLSPAVQQRHLVALNTLPVAETSPSRRRMLMIGGAVAVAVLGGAGTAAAFGVFDAPVTDRGTAHCYTTADLTRTDNHTDFGVAVSPGSQTAVGDAAAQAFTICADQWAKGRFRIDTPTFPDHATGAPTHPVPPLAACVLDNGQVAIFPGQDTVCANLGLTRASM